MIALGAAPSAQGSIDAVVPWSEGGTLSSSARARDETCTRAEVDVDMRSAPLLASAQASRELGPRWVGGTARGESSTIESYAYYRERAGHAIARKTREVRVREDWGRTRRA